MKEKGVNEWMDGLDWTGSAFGFNSDSELDVTLLTLLHKFWENTVNLQVHYVNLEGFSKNINTHLPLI